jgi:hypothetical protein
MKVGSSFDSAQDDIILRVLNGIKLSALYYVTLGGLHDVTLSGVEVH